MTYQEFKMSVLKSTKPAEQRYGQWAFNSLRKVRNDLAIKIVDETLTGNNDIDPFFDDKNLYSFWVWVEKNW